MLGAGRVDDERSGGIDAPLVLLGSGEDEDLFIAVVSVTWHLTARRVAKQRRGRSAFALVEVVNID